MDRFIELAKITKLTLSQKVALVQILVSVAEVLLAGWIIGPIIEDKFKISYTISGSLVVFSCWLVIIKLARTTK